MIRNQKILRTLAVFFIVEMLVSAVLPTFSWALTAGPTAPEATSFEPVDTTDMVNVVTGDFTYNLPLLEVPGPAGSYPLSLSYHAGIDPEEEASWIGLGWTLNPGSIFRLVNGYADDLNGPQFVDRVFWEGGEQTTYSIGVSVGLANCATVSAGLSFSQDTYRGFGTGGYLGGGVGFSPTDASFIGLSGRMGISPYGDPFAGASLGIGKAAGPLSGNLGLNTRSGEGIQAGMGAGISAGGAQAIGVGASISSSGIRSSVSVGGASANVDNSRQKNVTVSTDANGIDIPVFYGINLSLSREYVRYWIDERDATSVFGSIYFPNTYPSNDNAFLDDKAFDTYHMFENANFIIAGTDPEKTLGGTFADYDYYGVNAQGISGVMRPYHYWVTLSRQNKKNDGQVYDVKNYIAGQQYNADPNNTKMDFRFINDFSNKLKYNPPLIDVAQDNTPLSFFAGTPQAGPDNVNTLPSVAGSRYIEYFTNEEILSTTNPVKDRGFVECQASGFARSDALEKGTIGGFTITNTSGVNYHFSLPAYAYDEYTYSANRSDANGKTFNTLSQPVKYAYTWYLTAITGPDFVDRNDDGYANAGDWGYWIAFDYGKWTDCYRWRNPGTGYNADLDNNFDHFSKGKKEIYYLNSVRTASHTAFFVKEVRLDSKSANPADDQAVSASNGNIYWVDEGNFAEKFLTEIRDYSPYPYDIFPASLLKLNAIYILSNDDVEWNNLSARSTAYNFEDLGRADESRFKLFGQNVLDIRDLEGIEQEFKSKSIRSIVFETDYSLTNDVPNSYASTVDAAIAGITRDVSLQGKLTLKSIDFLGKSAQSFLPKLRFEYDVDNNESIYRIQPASVSGKEIVVNAASYPALTSYETGDLIYCEQGSSNFYGFISNQAADELTIKSITDDPANGPITLLKKTKNPPYRKDMHDIWKSYKVDYDSDYSDNLGHVTTTVSGKNADVWSLRKIHTQLGSTILVNYESDTFSKSVYNKNHSFIINSIGGFENVTAQNEVGSSINVTASLQTSGISLDEFFTPNQVIDIGLLYQLCYTADPASCHTEILSTATVIEVGSTFLKLRLHFAYQSSTPLSEAQLTFYGGNIYFQSQSRNYGGGIRVKSISIVEGTTGNARETAYDYEFNGVSTGVTPYVPVVMEKVSLPTASEEQILQYKMFLFYEFTNLLTLGRALPSPSVMYGKVRVRERIIDRGQTFQAPEFMEFEFETYNGGLVGRTSDDTRHFNNYSGESQTLLYDEIQVAKITIKDYSARLGNLKKMTIYDAGGRKMNETINKYLHDNLSNDDFGTNIGEFEPLLTTYDDQGVMQETFNHGRFIRKSNNAYKLIGIISKKETYPSIRTGTVVVNYKTGVRTETTNIGFDFYSGETLKILTNDGYGNYFLSETIPAYTVYDKMGRKNDYNGGYYGTLRRHMLVQPAAQYVFRVDGPDTRNKTHIVSAVAKTWSEHLSVLDATFDDQAVGTDPYKVGIWRASANYEWTGDKSQGLTGGGLQPFNEFQAFDFDNSVMPISWQKNAQISLYDVYSHVLQASDINGNYAATKMSSDQYRVLSTAENSRYHEFAYSGAEDDVDLEDSYGGAVKKLDGVEVFTQCTGDEIPECVKDVLTTHTGKKAVKVSSNTQSTFEYTFNSPDNSGYHASVWVNSLDGRLYYSVNGVVTASPGMPKESRKAGAWYLVNLDIPSTPENSTIRVWCTTNNAACTFDDFRVSPANALIMAYVYNKWGELSHILDNNNLYTEYRYDQMGRIAETWQESFQNGNSRLSKVLYHYAGQ